MPRKCTICVHKQVAAINKAICNSDSYRNIGKRFNVGHVSVLRHVTVCLNFKYQTLVEENRVAQAVNVYEEFQ